MPKFLRESTTQHCVPLSDILLFDDSCRSGDRQRCLDNTVTDTRRTGVKTALSDQLINALVRETGAATQH